MGRNKKNMEIQAFLHWAIDEEEKRLTEAK